LHHTDEPVTTHDNNGNRSEVDKIVRVPGQGDFILWSDYTGCCKLGEYDVELDAFVEICDPYPRTNILIANRADKEDQNEEEDDYETKTITRATTSKTEISTN
jgi:hypothetical protein